MNTDDSRRSALRIGVIFTAFLLLATAMFAAFRMAENQAAPPPRVVTQTPPPTPPAPAPEPAPEPVIHVAAAPTPAPALPPEPPPPPPPKPSEPDGEQPLNDLLAPLRGDTLYTDDHWKQMDAAFQHLARLDGAHFDKKTGTLTLLGPYTEAPGPYRLEDWCVALWGEFLSDGRLAMTIDPAAGNDLKQPMDVKFFGESRDTRMGQRMFECDWLLKGLSLGVEAIAPAAKRATIPEFATYLERTKVRKTSTQHVWSRFWLALVDENVDAATATVPIVINKEGDTLFIPPPRLFACTETMTEDARGILHSDKGRQDPAARDFVRHFNSHTAAFRREFPEIDHLHELARLVILARWIKDNAIPFDYELLYLRFEGASLKTPTKADVQSATTGTLKVSGGVNFRAPKLKPSTTDRYNAEALAKELAQPKIRTGPFTARLEIPTANARHYLILGPTTTAPPPAQRRPKLNTGEASAKATLTTRPPELTQGFDPIVHPEYPDFPVLRTGSFNGKPIHQGAWEIYTEPGHRVIKRTALTIIPDFLFITSPSGNINIRFGDVSGKTADLKYNQSTDEVYFETDAPGVTGYFPEKRELRFDNGGSVRFHPFTGMAESVKIPNGPDLSVQFNYPADGPLHIADSTKIPPRNRGPPDATKNPNPPRAALPLREATGITRITVTPSEISPWVTFENRTSGASVSTVRRAAELIHVEKGAAR